LPFNQLSLEKLNSFHKMNFHRLQLLINIGPDHRDELKLSGVFHGFWISIYLLVNYQLANTKQVI
jgi:hypothetical protein